jgi:hypothetical protein
MMENGASVARSARLQHRLGHALHELAHHVRVDGADHRVLRGEDLSPVASRTPLARPPEVRTCATSALQRSSPPKCSQAAHQRLGQLAAAADRLRDAVGVDDAGHQQHAHAGAQLVGALQVLADQAQQVDLDLVVSYRSLTRSRQSRFM